MNKKEWSIVCNYLNSTYTDSIYSAYARPSQRKVRALESCKEWERKFEGFDGKIVSKNSQVFTYAFAYVDSYPNDGIAHLFLCYITPYNVYYIDRGKCE